MTKRVTTEQADILEILRTRRYFLRFAVQGLTNEQAALRPTVSELTLGGLIKHVAGTEAAWARYITQGPSAMSVDKDLSEWGEAEWTARADEFRMVDGETLDGLLATYEEVAAHTDDLVTSIPDLNATQPLPDAPWFEKGGHRSARQVFLHISAETAQHAGHADILREAIDGQKTMG